ncbi:MAG: NnrS family protein [Gallionella sp.]|nr:NnrS family protein [Gallionella sp.]
MSRYTSHPVWLVGFRPFFIFAMLAGMILPALWVAIYTGKVAAPAHGFSAMQWHAHEMFFGFGWAVLGGFLLTATKNWVQVRGYHGWMLMFLAAAWLFERVGMWFEGVWPDALFYISNNLFLGSIVAALLWTLIRNRRTDTYRDNFLFLLILPLFLLTKHLMLSADYAQIGNSMAVGLFRVAILVMLERTLSAFMKAAFQVELLKNIKLNMAIKLLAVSMVISSLMTVQLAAAGALLLAVLLAVRLAYWQPRLAMRRLDIAIMYLGYLAVVTQLLIESFRLTGHFSVSASWSIHVFTLGAMGLIIPAMLVRIGKGHTGRKVNFDSLDKSALYLMMVAFVFRILAPLFYPINYSIWVTFAAACWFACFTLMASRYIPMLMQPRVDGKAH